MHRPEMIILAPAHELDNRPVAWAPIDAAHRRVGDTYFSDWVEEFLDEGIYFDFDEHQQLPVDLPADLAGVRCIVIDQSRREEFQSGKKADRLLQFRQLGGYVFWVGEPHGTLRPRVLRAIPTAGLTMQHPELIRTLHHVDEQMLLDFWRRTARQQIRVLMDADAGWAWGDPVPNHYFWPMEAAAQYFKDPSWMEPAWEAIAEGLDMSRWSGEIACGRRFALKYAERVGDRSIIERIVHEVNGTGGGKPRGTLWRLDGVTINMDLFVPEGADRDNPPAMVRENAWVWPEVTGNMAESLSYLSKATGDMSFVDRAMHQVRTHHQWSFNPRISLWHHMGRPTGPDMRSAPWGRGNGWMLYGIRGLLEDLPENHGARAELVSMLAAALEGLLRYQTPSGLWRNVLDAREDESRTETAGAWMIVNTYARAYWKGWLRDPRIIDMCERAWKGLKTKIWRGIPISHCSGTTYQLTRQGYLERPHHRFLGYAPMLSLIEILRMREASRRAE